VSQRTGRCCVGFLPRCRASCAARVRYAGTCENGGSCSEQEPPLDSPPATIPRETCTCIFTAQGRSKFAAHRATSK
jgi:hypothetical protein